MPSGQAVKWLTSSEESEAANPTRTHLPAAPDMRQLWPNPLKACSLSIPVSSREPFLLSNFGWEAGVAVVRLWALGGFQSQCWASIGTSCLQCSPEEWG